MDEIKKRKTAVLTGYNRGIGESISIKLAEAGYNLILCSRKSNNALIKNLIDQFKIEVYEYKFDLSNSEQTIKTANEIKKFAVEKKLEIDLLVNNAGVLKTGLFIMENIEDFKKIFEVNFFSQVFFTKEIIPLLKKSKSSSIINISSTSALEHDIGRMPYNASKAAIISFTKTLSKELSMFGIRVNCIAPGLIETDMLRSFTSEKVINEVISRNLSKRVGKKDEIAKLIVFLASTDSSYINGQIIRIDGGMF